MKVFNENFEPIKSFKAHKDTINRIKQSPNNNQYVTTCSADESIKIWDIINDWQLVRTYTGHTYEVLALEYLSEDRIASADSFGTIAIWYMSSGLDSNVFINTGGSYSGTYSLQILTNGIHLAAGHGDGQIKIYNIISGKLKATLPKKHVSFVFDLVLINAELLASSSGDYTACVWNLTANSNKFILNGHQKPVTGLRQVSVDVLSSGSLDTTINLWNLTNGRLIRTLSNHTRNIYSSLDMLNETLVSGSYDQTINFWNIRTGHCLKSVYTGFGIFSLAVVNSTKSKFLFLKQVF
jgi:WD40 repeat protein